LPSAVSACPWNGRRLEREAVSRRSRKRGLAGSLGAGHVYHRHIQRIGRPQLPAASRSNRVGCLLKSIAKLPPRPPTSHPIRCHFFVFEIVEHHAKWPPSMQSLEGQRLLLAFTPHAWTRTGSLPTHGRRYPARVSLTSLGPTMISLPREGCARACREPETREALPWSGGRYYTPGMYPQQDFAAQGTRRRLLESGTDTGCAAGNPCATTVS
jgi:hypothetical protein